MLSVAEGAISLCFLGEFYFVGWERWLGGEEYL